MNLLYVLFVLDVLNLAVFLPVFGAFVRSIGGTPFSLGLINSGAALVSLLWNPIVGSLSDQVGRKGLLMKCLLASAVGSLILTVSTSLPLVFVGRFIGSFGSPVAILLRSIVADTYKTPEEKKSFFSKSAPLMSIGFLAGSVSSGFLSEAKNGYSMSFLLMAIITGTATAIAFHTVPDDTKSKEKLKKSVSFSSKAATKLKSAIVNIKTISWPRYQSLFCIKGFYDLSISIIFSSVALTLLNEFQVKGRTMGYVFMTTSLCRIASSLLNLKLKNAMVNVRDNSKLVAVGIVLLVSYIAMSLSGSLGVFMVFLGVMCFSRAFMDTTLTAIIATKTTQADRGKVIGAYENLYSVSMFVAPLLTGALSESLGQRVIISSAAIPISVATFIAYRSTEKTE